MQDYEIYVCEKWLEIHAVSNMPARVLCPTTIHHLWGCENCMEYFPEIGTKSCPCPTLSSKEIAARIEFMLRNRPTL